MKLPHIAKNKNTLDGESVRHLRKFAYLLHEKTDTTNVSRVNMKLHPADNWRHIALLCIKQGSRRKQSAWLHPKVKKMMYQHL